MPYLFILCVEILASAVRNNDGIKGIRISETECKISQYADDTTLILDGTDISAKHSLGLLDSFAEISGLKVNYEKTEALWIGSLRFQKRRIETSKNILSPLPTPSGYLKEINSLLYKFYGMENVIKLKELT